MSLIGRPINIQKTTSGIHKTMFNTTIHDNIKFKKKHKKQKQLLMGIYLNHLFMTLKRRYGKSLEYALTPN